VTNGSGRHGDAEPKSREAYIQHHGPIVGRLKYLFGGGGEE
jgi:hypothetical protein